MAGLTWERLHMLLNYDAETGVFTWKIKRKQVNPGDLAGCTKGKRYRHIQIDSRTYLAHRLAWFYIHGTWPIYQIDHINNDHFDNRITNLREASAAENTRNRPGRLNTLTGIKGVCFRPRLNKWEANIMCNGIAIYLGQFATAELAQQAYGSAAHELHGEFAWGQS
jgi:hypothetical protein